jgi:very-short-patch-repair endonuclease
MIPYNRNLIEPARELRAHPTKAEKCLWQRLQLKHLGIKFYRQKPLGNYIVDFFCPVARLVIEVDGGHHFTKAGKENDKLRDEYIESSGLKVLRFSNSYVINNTDEVVARIKKILLYPPFKKGDNPGNNSRRPYVKKTSSSFVKGGAEADFKK